MRYPHASAYFVVRLSYSSTNCYFRLFYSCSYFVLQTDWLTIRQTKFKINILEKLSKLGTVVTLNCFCNNHTVYYLQILRGIYGRKFKWHNERPCFHCKSNFSNQFVGYCLNISSMQEVFDAVNFIFKHSDLPNKCANSSELFLF